MTSTDDEGLARVFLDWVAGANEPRDDVALARAAAALAERNAARSGAQRWRSEVACRRGCAWCCRLPVTVSAPEAVRALAAARERLDAPALRALAARVGEAAAAYGGDGTPPARGRHPPCPLLEAEQCLVYEARPLACRGWNSLDAHACRDACEPHGDPAGIPSHARLRAAYSNAAEALARGRMARGHREPAYLIPALAAALDDAGG